MKALFIIVIILTTSLFSAEETIVTVLTKSGMSVSGIIDTHVDGWLIVSVGENVQILPGGINFSNGTIKIAETDIILIDYGMKTMFKNETDSTKKADLLNLLNQILPKGI